MDEPATPKRGQNSARRRGERGLGVSPHCLETQGDISNVGEDMNRRIDVEVLLHVVAAIVEWD
jgi:hypothetical protein